MKRFLRVVIGLVFFCVACPTVLVIFTSLYSIGTGLESPAETIEPPSSTAWMTGIDRTPTSSTYGELIVPQINVWSSWGSVMGSAVGQVRHGQQVQILEALHHEELDRDFYRIDAGDVTGWVVDSFIQFEPVS